MPYFERAQDKGPEQEWKRAPIIKDDGELDFVDKAVLGGAHLLSKIGLGGDASKMYDRIVYRRDTSTVTIDDISPSMRKFLKAIVEAKAKDTGKLSGTISYDDYKKYSKEADPENWIGDTPWDMHYRSFSVFGSPGHQAANTLGAFRYEKSDAGISIRDSYDFNLYQPMEDNPEAKAAAASVNPMGALVNIGRKVIPPGKGVPVNIDIK